MSNFFFQFVLLLSSFFSSIFSRTVHLKSNPIYFLNNCKWNQNFFYTNNSEKRNLLFGKVMTAHKVFSSFNLLCKSIVILKMFVNLNNKDLRNFRSTIYVRKVYTNENYLSFINMRHPDASYENFYYP